jgi:predicted membrane protein
MLFTHNTQYQPISSNIFYIERFLYRVIVSIGVLLFFIKIFCIFFLVLGIIFSFLCDFFLYVLILFQDTEIERYELEESAKFIVEIWD